MAFGARLRWNTAAVILWRSQPRRWSAPCLRLTSSGPLSAVVILRHALAGLPIGKQQRSLLPQNRANAVHVGDTHGKFGQHGAPELLVGAVIGGLRRQLQDQGFGLCLLRG